jgi:hypothetical protein
VAEGWTKAVADPVRVAAIAAELSNAYLECREARKHWYRPRTVRWMKAAKVYEQVRRCGVCKAVEQVRLLTEDAHIVSSHVRYVKPDYLFKAGGRMDADSMAALRLEQLHRVGQIEVWEETG